MIKVRFKNAGLVSLANFTHKQNVFYWQALESKETAQHRRNINTTNVPKNPVFVIGLS